MMKHLVLAGLASLGLFTATPAEARHGHSRSHVSVTFGYGSPYYYDDYYYAPRYYRYREPVYYYDDYYYDRPRYRYRPVRYHDRHYSRRYRHHDRGYHRGWRHHGDRGRYRHRW